MPKTILSFSRDQILLETRAAILRKSGHNVLSVVHLDQFLEALEQHDVELVVLGHTVPSNEREDVYRMLSEVNCMCPVIELYATALAPKSPAHFHLAIHDRTFQTDLLQLVRQVLAEDQN